MHLNSRAPACPAAEKRQQSWIKMVAGVASFTPQESARQIRVPATATTARSYLRLLGDWYVITVKSRTSCSYAWEEVVTYNHNISCPALSTQHI